MNAKMQPMDEGYEASAEGVPMAPPMTDDEIRAQIEEARARRAMLMDGVGARLESLKDEAVTYRANFEQEWVENIRQYEGEVNSVSSMPAQNKERGKVSSYNETSDNITRPKVQLIAARISDMIFPTSDRNWDITPSPDAELPPGSFAASNEMTPAQLEAAEQEESKRRCDAMRTQIDDQLQQSSYDSHGRRVIMDMVKHGTGVLKGPFARSRSRRRMSASAGWQRVIEETIDPGVSWVDLWDFYPQACRSIDEAEHVFQLHAMTAAKLRQLANQPGFDKSQIRRILGVSPNWSSILNARASAAGPQSIFVTANTDGRYPMWEYHGPIPKDALIEFLTQIHEQAGISAEQLAALVAKITEDPLAVVNGEAWFCNGIVAKLALEPVDDAQDGLYHVVNFEESDDSIFGHGVCKLLRSDARAVDQLWHAMMLNSQMSSAPQIGVNVGGLEAGAKGGAADYSFTKPRVWKFAGDTADIREAMQVFIVPNVIGNILPLYERAKQNADEHVMMPLIAQGDATSAVPTSSGLAMLMNAANIVTRRLAKAWDDNVTTPLLNAIYDWNLRYGKDEANGDFNIIPRGVSHLLVKDIQSQRLLFAMQAFAANPKLEPRMKWDGWATEMLRVMDIDSKPLVMTNDEFKQAMAEQQQSAQPNPEMIKAEAQQAVAQARIKEAEARTAAAEARNQLEQLRMNSDAILAREGMASDERIAQIKLQIALAGLNAAERRELAKNEATMAKEGMWARIEAAKIAASQQETALEISVEAPNPRLA